MDSMCWAVVVTSWTIFTMLEVRVHVEEGVCAIYNNNNNVIYFFTVVPRAGEKGFFMR